MENTYKIAVIDDRVDLVEKFMALIQEIMPRNRINRYLVHSYSDGKELYKSVVAMGNRYDIYFYSMNHRDKNIMKYAELLRNKDIRESFVYITNDLNQAFNGYKVNLLDYLFEPIHKDLLEKLLLYDYENNFCLRYIPLKKNSNVFYINTENIVCVEVKGRGIKLYLVDISDLNMLAKEYQLLEDLDSLEKSLYYTEKLSDFKERLNPVIFFKCHQSFIVNITKIRSLKRYQAVLNNKTAEGIRADISKKYWKDMSRCFMESKKRNQIKQRILFDEDLEEVAGGRQILKGSHQDVTRIWDRKKED